MRFVLTAAPLIAICLSSCRIGVDFAVVNRAQVPVTLYQETSAVRLIPGSEEKLSDVPDTHVISVAIGRCTRTFNLDEHYSPANEWRLSTFGIIRRYSVDQAGLLRIEAPDPRLASARPSTSAYRLVALTPIAENCRQ